LKNKIKLRRGKNCLYNFLAIRNFKITNGKWTFAGFRSCSPPFSYDEYS
jgi:hypothetical protein